MMQFILSDAPQVFGSNCNDLYKAPATGVNYNGCGGYDTVVLPKSVEDYKFQGWGCSLLATDSNNVSYSLTSVEFLTFETGNATLAVSYYPGCAA